MKINIDFSNASVNAALRHVYTVLGTVGGMLALAGYLTPDQVTAIVAAVHQIGDGIVKVIAGFGSLIPILSAAYAAYKVRPSSVAATVAQTPGLKVVPTTAAGQAIIDAMPPAAKEANK